MKATLANETSCHKNKHFSAHLLCSNCNLSTLSKRLFTTIGTSTTTISCTTTTTTNDATTTITTTTTTTTTTAATTTNNNNNAIPI
jgi:hypothetical protein